MLGFLKDLLTCLFFRSTVQQTTEHYLKIASGPVDLNGMYMQLHYTVYIISSTNDRLARFVTQTLRHVAGSNQNSGTREVASF